MEFGDTEAYRVSKEAQKMQSEVETTQTQLFAHNRGQSVCVCAHVCVFTPSESVLHLSASLLHTIKLFMSLFSGRADVLKNE